MKNFSSAYKTSFKQLLLPHGYALKRNYFYKMEENLCFFVLTKSLQPRFSRMPGVAFDTLVDFVPFCVDVADHEYDPSEDAIPIRQLLGALVPGGVPVEELHRRMVAGDEDRAGELLDQACKDLEELVLPYIHRFTDLELFYSEYLKLLETDERARVDCNQYVYGLSIKLHHYESALPYLERQVGLVNGRIESSGTVLTEFEKGNIDPATRHVAQKRPELIELKMRAARRTIDQSQQDLERLQAIKDALLSKDDRFLDEYISGIENNSREYFNQMLHP